MSLPQAGVPLGTFPDGPPGSDNPISDEVMIGAATSVQSVTVDGQMFTERSISELIELDKYLKGRKVTNAWGSIGRARAIQPGGNGRDACGPI